MSPTILVVIVWLFAAGQPPKIAYVAEPNGVMCEQARLVTQAALEKDPAVRYVEGHCYSQGNKA